MPSGRSALPVAAIVAAIVATAAACGGGGSVPPPAASPPPPPSTTLPAQAEGWEALPGAPTSPANARHDDVFFLDAARGFLVNTRGEVHATENGGASWALRARLPDGVAARCVGFVSATQGFVGNYNRTFSPQPDFALWETGDGGRTWSNVSTRISGAPVAGLCGMRVIDANTVVAVGRWNGPPVFVKTTDRGRSWSSTSLGGQASGLTDLHFFNGQDGFAVGAIGDGASDAEARVARTVILATTDGGATWTTRYQSAEPGQRAWKVHFASDRVGFVSTEGIAPQGVVVKTTDGGASWQPVAVSPGRSFEGIAFLDPARGWVASGDTLYSTADGGATWRALGYGQQINRIRVIDDTLAYACGATVYRWRR